MENIQQPNYEIFIRDRNFDIAGVVTKYSRLEFRKVYNAVGGWMLDMESRSSSAQLMKSLFRDEVGAYNGIIVTRNGRIVFSGVTRGFEQTGEYVSEEDQDNITFYGMDDIGLLSMRMLMVPIFQSNPQVFTAPSNQNWDVWRYPTQTASNIGYSVSRVIYTTVADNISFRAPLSRQIPELYVQRPASIGPRSIMRGRYQNLLQKVQEISYFLGDNAFQRTHPSYPGVQFRCRQLDNPIYVYTSGGRINTPVPSNLVPPSTSAPPSNSQIKKVQFDIQLPRDLRNSVVFSKGFKNMGRFRYKLSAPQSTFVVLGGQNNAATLTNTNHTPNPIILQDGDPRTRWFSHSGSNSGRLNLISQYGLWETFLDKRDIQYGQAIQGAGVSDPYPRRPSDSFNPQPVAPKAIQNYNDMQQEMTQAMQTELIEKRELLEVEIEAINIRPTIWSINYDVGDIVTVVLPTGEQFAAKVKEVTVTLTKDKGEVVTAIIGTETQPNGRDIFSNLVRVNKKTNNLEELR